MVRVKLWDWPVRLIHWSFALLLPSLWWTWKKGDMALHERLGYVTLALLVFRLIWGFAGGSTARFSGFVKGPRAVAGYVTKLIARDAEPIVGHNPLGGWSALLLLGLMVIEVGLGLFTQDVDGLESGPLTRYVSYETADLARYWHGFVFDALLWLVALHVSAILFYLVVKRDNLVGPMFTGRKRMAKDAAMVTFTPPWRGALIALLSAGFAYWISRGAPL